MTVERLDTGKQLAVVPERCEEKFREPFRQEIKKSQNMQRRAKRKGGVVVLASRPERRGGVEWRVAHRASKLTDNDLRVVLHAVVEHAQGSALQCVVILLLLVRCRHLVC